MTYLLGFVDDSDRRKDFALRHLIEELSARIYISPESSYPTSLAKHIYKSIQHRLSTNTTADFIFDDGAIACQKTLSKGKLTARL